MEKNLAWFLNRKVPESWSIGASNFRVAEPVESERKTPAARDDPVAEKGAVPASTNQSQQTLPRGQHWPIGDRVGSGGEIQTCVRRGAGVLIFSSQLRFFAESPALAANGGAEAAGVFWPLSRAARAGER